MCVIIIKQKGDVMSEDILKNSARINPHGLGIVWLDTFDVSYHKSTDYGQLITSRPFIAHFRYATIGKVSLENAHPFVCGDNKDELLMHNGTVQGFGDVDTPDSKALAEYLGTKDRRKWKSILEKYDSRFVTINTRTRSFQVYNRNLYTYRDGVWYSKSNVLQDNLVAVYGTLKKGHSNYFHYLESSKYIGSGTTKDKYPLIIQGLPYLVNKRGVGHNVEVDVFKVSDNTFEMLDQLEGHPRWYRRERIKIKMDNGSELLCWVYFNPKDVSSKTLMHKSYIQQRASVRQVSELVEDNDCYSYDIGWDDDDFPTDETPTCIDCYGDLKHDGFANYYCSSCGGWFVENEVLKY